MLLKINRSQRDSLGSCGRAGYTFVLKNEMYNIITSSTAGEGRGKQEKLVNTKNEVVLPRGIKKGLK